LVEKRLIVAGSIVSRAQIRAIAAAGADAFTVGSAVLDGSYAPQMGSVLSQLGAIQADLEPVR
jgi:heptaprenylglyceryl phosphate synthase